jgi:exodeoxyribonuclease VII large subunit
MLQSAMDLDHLENLMNRAVRQKISQSDQELKEMAARMNSINPLAVLARGYSLTTDAAGQLLVDCKSLVAGDKIKTRLAHGQIISTVEQSKPETE